MKLLAVDAIGLEVTPVRRELRMAQRKTFDSVISSRSIIRLPANFAHQAHSN
jgi:hypothetical protein